MVKKPIKIIGIIIICVVLISIFIINSNKSFAITDVTENPGAWSPTSDDVGEKILSKKMGPILMIIRNVGIIISVLTLSVIALKIMFSSVEGKAEYKQKLLPWLIGAFMVFSMTTIPSFIYDLVYDETIQNQEETQQTEKEEEQKNEDNEGQKDTGTGGSGGGAGGAGGGSNKPPKKEDFGE